MFNVSLPNIEPKRLAVKLTPVGERSVRSGHPWLFSNSIVKINKEGSAGDLAIIFGNRSNEVIGVGLYDPDSPIRIKMLTNNGPVTITSEFFSDRIARAYSIRLPLLASSTNSYRLIFGENDRFPGFIADMYANVLVVKLYSEIWLPYLKEILKVLIEVSSAVCVVLRLSRKLQEKNDHGLYDGLVLYGTLENENVLFVEYGVNFSANVIHGHKTGYFLDHRNNRKRVGELAKGKSVLDVFSYTGGFSVHALVNGAKEVTSLDISKQALEVASYNASLNEYTGTHQTIAGDAFEIMEQLISEGKTYDIVVIDPPSFAKRASEIKKAEKKYAQLSKLGTSLTAMRGILVLASCSSRISSEVFFSINEKSLNESGRNYTLLDKTAHDIDHPVTFPEGAYLKTGYYQF
ncbi:MAG: class I SAM-dependent rRNA methyltransferase [Bacteroidia bacterium]|nr:class I SAM-dependent rRNA methyltransferase [Bacteroidia bacterium]NNF31393.1 methyltransferase domain-containing protein [Flavobacteriaceae bacterium]MBT8275940.1 class I SAM-dependent rRNA methyltransferase [Bacteroidia bacterium]NNJ81677.1 methyltransferase domain-containing protein [Flavobacteriaceae bacterium]NNK53015.1 methyltransferase domain-containing protein [Flavobacteriaceae bacterium]